MENELHNEIQRFEEKHKNISKTTDEIYDYQIVSDFFYNMLIDLEDRSRTNNLIQDKRWTLEEMRRKGWANFSWKAGPSEHSCRTGKPCQEKQKR